MGPFLLYPSQRNSFHPFSDDILLWHTMYKESCIYSVLGDTFCLNTCLFASLSLVIENLGQKNVTKKNWLQRNVMHSHVLMSPVSFFKGCLFCHTVLRVSWVFQSQRNMQYSIIFSSGSHKGVSVITCQPTEDIQFKICCTHARTDWDHNYEGLRSAKLEMIEVKIVVFVEQNI